MTWAVLSMVRSLLKVDRVYQRVMSLCLLIALVLALVGQLWPSTTFAATVAAIATAATALGIYFAASDEAMEDDLGKKDDWADGDKKSGYKNASAHSAVSVTRSEDFLSSRRAMHFQRLYMSHVESDHSRYLSSYIFKRTNDVSSDYARRALRKYEDLCAVLLEDEITVRQQSLERLYQQMLELQKVERAWVKASSTLGAPPGGGRFEVNVGPLKIIVTEDGTTVEVSNAKAATVNFVQPEKPTTVTLGTAHPATPTPTVEASRTIH